MEVLNHKQKLVYACNLKENYRFGYQTKRCVYFQNIPNFEEAVQNHYSYYINTTNKR